MDEIVNRIFDIAKQHEKKNLVEIALKGSEEMGELAQAVLSYQKCPGCEYKKLGLSKVAEEACDVIIVAMALLSKADVSKDVMKVILNDKLDKWFNKTVEASSNDLSEILESNKND